MCPWSDMTIRQSPTPPATDQATATSVSFKAPGVQAGDQHGKEMLSLK